MLFAIRDAAYTDLGYDERTLAIMDSGQPEPRMGDVFVSLHQGAIRQDMMNSKNEYMDFMLTLTQRVTVPLDRVGDSLLAKKLARESGFNKRAYDLSNYFHMAWAVLQGANTYLVRWNPDAPTVYGFCEPAHFAGMDTPVLVGPEWFMAEMPEEGEGTDDVGLKAVLRFADCRRLQALGTFT